jgi:hypothetical protein
MLFSDGAARELSPGFFASADPALSFDAARVLFAGKRTEADAWQVWEAPVAGGAPRQLTSGSEDCIRPFYLPEGKFVYARRTGRGYQIEVAPLAGGPPARLTYLSGDQIPNAVLRDGRILFEAPHPASGPGVRDLYEVYTDGSGVETHRCDHGRDRHDAAELASGDIVFQTGTRLARFTSARAAQLEIALPRGEFSGPVAETGVGEWLASYRRAPGAPFGIYVIKPEDAAAPQPVVSGGAFQPILLAPRPVPPYHPSSLGNREGANVLCLNAYTSKDARIPAGVIAAVRVWSQDANGAPFALGSTGVDPDGSFYLQVPSERPLRFELLGKDGRTFAAGKGWFWMRKGEQRVCVGCHAGPERAPDNVAPRVLLRTQTPVRIGLSQQGDSK